MTSQLYQQPAGVYTLDVITQKGSTKAAYEGILVISQQPTTVINETTRNVINQEINLNIRDDDDEECPSGSEGKPSFCVTPPEDGVCPEGQVGTPPNCVTPPEDGPPEDDGQGEEEDGQGEEEDGGEGGQELPLPLFGAP